MISHDSATRKELSPADVLRQAPSDLNLVTRTELEKSTISDQTTPKLSLYSIVNEKNLVTVSMRSGMVKKRLHIALLFALINKYKQLLEWILNHLNLDPHYPYTSSGRNLMFYAVFSRNMARIKELLALKVNWQVPDAAGLTPANLAFADQRWGCNHTLWGAWWCTERGWRREEKEEVSQEKTSIHQQGTFMVRRSIDWLTASVIRVIPSIDWLIAWTSKIEKVSVNLRRWTIEIRSPSIHEFISPLQTRSESAKKKTH